MSKKQPGTLRSRASGYIPPDARGIKGSGYRAVEADIGIGGGAGQPAKVGRLGASISSAACNKC